MNPRERVMLALDHKEPDRIPIDLGATIVSSIAKTSYISLKGHLGMPLEEIKKKTDAKIFFHGCGATFDLIPDLIELGFDILNPVQVPAKGMDTKKLKQTYGKDITFWGGSVDT